MEVRPHGNEVIGQIRGAGLYEWLMPPETRRDGKGRVSARVDRGHTLATAAAAHDIDMRKIQMMLGHDDIDTTERVYAEFRQGYLSDVARLADPHIKALNAVKSQQKSQL